jgi:nucleotide-binding universal stress UspA family protein
MQTVAREPQGIRTLLAGVEEVSSTHPVLRYAWALAQRLDAVLHVVHGFRPVDPIPADPGLGVAFFPGVMPGHDDEMGRTLIRRLDDVVSELGGGSRIVPHVVAGAAHAEIARVAGEVAADLILVGATRSGRVGRALFGTTAARTLRTAKAPVMVVRAEPGAPVRRVLLTTDLSALSDHACRVGVELVRSIWGRQVEFRCLSAAWAGGELPPPDSERLQSAVAAELGRLLAPLEAGGAAIHPVVRLGDPHEEILAEAASWPADLVVLGTHGRSGLSRLFLGGVAEPAVRDLTCSALMIPASGD